MPLVWGRALTTCIQIPECGRGGSARRLCFVWCGGRWYDGCCADDVAILRYAKPINGGCMEVVLDLNAGHGLFEHSGVVTLIDWNNTTPDLSHFAIPSFCPN